MAAASQPSQKLPEGCINFWPRTVCWTWAGEPCPVLFMHPSVGLPAPPPFPESPNKLTRGGRQVFPAPEEQAAEDVGLWETRLRPLWVSHGPTGSANLAFPGGSNMKSWERSPGVGPPGGWLAPPGWGEEQGPSFRGGKPFGTKRFGAGARPPPRGGEGPRS